MTTTMNKERRRSFIQRADRDSFATMSELLRELPAEANYAFQIDQTFGSAIKVFAPHGGCIEPCTGPIARAIAAGRYDSFVFQGIRKRDCFKTLHVTSTRYDEPRCIAMARASLLGLAVHGCSGEELFIHVGGGNKELARRLSAHLSAHLYPVSRASADLQGESGENFINLARHGGIQLELSAGFRRAIFPSFPKSLQPHPLELPRFVTAMRSGLELLELTL